LAPATSKKSLPSPILIRISKFGAGDSQTAMDSTFDAQPRDPTGIVAEKVKPTERKQHRCLGRARARKRAAGIEIEFGALK
jgi:hypothetical protein